MPFDILSGDTGMRETLQNRKDIKREIERWAIETEEFKKEFSEMKAYSE